jgi:RND family efflux transporter MFP subunit
MRPTKKSVLPILVVLLGVVAATGLLRVRPMVATHRAARPLPLVRAMAVQLQDVQLRVEAQGSITPRTESDLVAEVAGRITWVSPNLAAGGFFEKDELLARIDASDYELAVERAEAALTRAQSELALARAHLERRRSLAERGVVSAAALDEAVSAERVATAVVRDARAFRSQARRDLERSRIVAPFAGRVREKRVDVGQFVSRGVGVARIYAVDYAEVRLPIPDREAAFLDLPIDYRGEAGESDGPEVLLRARFAGREYTWTGTIVRTEGEMDPRTRMIQTVARIQDPYGRSAQPERPPLAVGMFVKAEISGRLLEDIVVLPRSALRGRDQVVVVDAENRLRLRRIEILRKERETVVIAGGLAPGELVCTSPLETVDEGSEVKIVVASAAGARSEAEPSEVHKAGARSEAEPSEVHKAGAAREAEPSEVQKAGAEANDS